MKTDLLDLAKGAVMIVVFALVFSFLVGVCEQIRGGGQVEDYERDPVCWVNNGGYMENIC